MEGPYVDHVSALVSGIRLTRFPLQGVIRLPELEHFPNFARETMGGAVEELGVTGPDIEEKLAGGMTLEAVEELFFERHSDVR